MQCPICKQTVSWEGNPFRPFCSERCKLIDLDNWIEERYRVPAATDAADESVAPDPGKSAKEDRD